MEITPIFSSDYTIGKSILSVENEQKIKPLKPVSVIAIAKTHGLKQLVITDSEFSGFWKLHENTKKNDIQLIFGFKLTACDDLGIEEGSLRTDGDVLIFLKNDQAYYDSIPIYTEASTIGYYKGSRRITWNRLNELWTDNLAIALPFYSSFLANNTLKLFHSANPNFGKLKPTIFLQNHELPIDHSIRLACDKFVKSSGFPTKETHQIYYYKRKDSMAHLTFRCINERGTWEKPELAGYCSQEFCWEAYEEKTK
jgi:DNA polymerase III alpha subunit